jgi:phosphohistidine phosphatase SixA
MILYLARHAEAVPVGGSVPPDGKVIRRDHDRPLSHKGERDARMMGSLLGHIDSSIALVLSSPLHRAKQTAQLMREGLPNAPAHRESKSLAPGFQAEDLLEEILALDGEGSVVAVGHQPDIGQCIASLAAHDAPLALDVVPCAIAKLSIRGPVSHPQVRLSWFLTPELVRHIVPQT